MFLKNCLSLVYASTTNSAYYFVLQLMKVCRTELNNSKNKCVEEKMKFSKTICRKKSRF